MLACVGCRRRCWRDHCQVDLMTDPVEFVIVVNAALIGAWGIVFGVIRIVHFFAAVAGR